MFFRDDLSVARALLARFRARVPHARRSCAPRPLRAARHALVYNAWWRETRYARKKNERGPFRFGRVRALGAAITSATEVAFLLNRLRALNLLKIGFHDHAHSLGGYLCLFQLHFAIFFVSRRWANFYFFTITSIFALWAHARERHGTLAHSDAPSNPTPTSAK